MIERIPLSVTNPKVGCEAVLNAWKRPETKVVVTSVDQPLSDVREFYQSLFPLLGTPAPFAEDATKGDRSHQRTGEVWMEVRYDPTIPNAYRHSSNAQPLHTDGSYVPGFPNSSLLCCVRNAGRGGETTFIDAAHVATALRQNEPQLFERLTSEVIPHARSGDRREELVIHQVAGQWRVNWNFYCVAEDVSPEVKAVAEKLHQFLQADPFIQKNLLEVKLAPGEAVMWKDNEVLHGRNSFEANQAGDRFIWKCAFDVGAF